MTDSPPLDFDPAGDPPPAADPPPAEPPAGIDPDPADEPDPDPDRCASSSDGIHRWTDQVEGLERIRTTVQVCGACGRRVELGEEIV